jgi:hypothetical protein
MRPLVASLALAGAISVAACISAAYARPRHQETRIVAHPHGCPARAFCGCGVSVRVFGRPIRSLFLAANWRRFPSAAPGAGMVAWRPGHVFYIVRMIERGIALAYDPNSGGHLTRVHRRSLAGFRVVDPRGSRLANN